MTKLIVIFRNFAKTPKISRSVVEAGGISQAWGETTCILLRKSEEIRPLEGLAVDGRVTLKLII